MVKAQFALAMNLRLFDVHIEAEGAPVQLRGSDGDKIPDWLFNRSLSRRTKKFNKFLQKSGDCSA